jgi:hypothetical protein
MVTIHPQPYVTIYFHVLLLIVMVTVSRLIYGNYHESPNKVSAFLFALYILNIKKTATGFQMNSL